MQTIPGLRNVQRVRHEPKRRTVQVARVEPLGDELVRVVFRGDDLADFVSLGFDDHVKLIVEDGRGTELFRRDYTPRTFDRHHRELAIDFALHGTGYAANWARNATPGQGVIIGGPRGSMIVPTDYPWHLLAGDTTALPAIARRLEELPSGVRAIVVLQAADSSPLGRVHCHAALDLYLVANAVSFIETIRSLRLPADEGYAWCAGEAATMARVRDILITDKGHPREAMRVAAYWKKGARDYHDEIFR